MFKSWSKRNPCGSFPILFSVFCSNCIVLPVYGFFQNSRESARLLKHTSWLVEWYLRNFVFLHRKQIWISFGRTWASNVWIYNCHEQIPKVQAKHMPEKDFLVLATPITHADCCFHHTIMCISPFTHKDKDIWRCWYVWFMSCHVCGKNTIHELMLRHA